MSEAALTGLVHQEPEDQEPKEQEPKEQEPKNPKLETRNPKPEPAQRWVASVTVTSWKLV